MRLHFFIFLSVFCGSFIQKSNAQNKLQSELKIISRAEWNAAPPVLEMIPHTPRFITIHHTGMPQKPELSIEKKLRGLQDFSQKDSKLASGKLKKAWADVPYHFYISTSGDIAEARNVNYQGDSNTDYNLDGHLLIVVEGNFNKEKVLPEQWKSLKQLVPYVSEKYNIPLSSVSGHKDQAKTTCPGDDLYRLLPLLKTDKRVRIGAERLFEEEYFKLIQGQRIGLITNHTGLLPNIEHLVDLLHENPETNLKLLFGPEHGIRGEQDTHVSDSKDKTTGLPVISLYGDTQRPTPEMLEQIDVLIFDIQDIGARYYTYIRTMLFAMEAAAESGIPYIVLDRPNPINAETVAGPIGNSFKPVLNIESLPVVHGMTIGELATMFNKEREKTGKSTAELSVVPLENYRRSFYFDETGLPWIKSSPNMLNLTTALLYPATCLLEGTNFSEGRGTLQPFELIGAPWVKAGELSELLNSYKLPGAKFSPGRFKPDSIVDGIKIYPPKFVGEETPAVEISITNRNELKPVELGIYILHALIKQYPNEFEWKEKRIDHLLKTSKVREMLNKGESPENIIGQWKEELEYFQKKREKYLLY
ncbi:exo-beta-N-acetylmuramidase NamZ domain-containing protein [Christiangramia echinicola]|uniref:exo-beta-N-acetylmuramidase NamZ domain-containing protein n=1 Tax=Christiangramia echinicola TaxID=279359 RepID=UPI000410F3F1|nr:exo-beta-N-acetylmuramidase NamZ domain-containing protein [Christiangramia echinicola]